MGGDDAGALVRQVAVGYPNLDHTSLAVSPDGNWLLSTSGNALYVSRGGATPRELTAGLVAAAGIDTGERARDACARTAPAGAILTGFLPKHQTSHNSPLNEL